MKIIDLDESIINEISAVKLHNAIDVLEFTKTIEGKPEICLCGMDIFKSIFVYTNFENAPVWESVTNRSFVFGEEDKKILFMRAPDLKPNQILII
jgi:hypothetical protein